MNTQPPVLILFSGLAADESVFLPQKIAFPDLIVPAWPTPEVDESLASYCERLASELTPHRPCILGGASFGGIIALEVARFLKPQAVVLIGSIRSPAEFPRWVRFSRRLRPLIGLFPVRCLQLLMSPFAGSQARAIAPHLAGVVRQFCRSNPAVFRWSLRQLLAWKEPPALDCPVIHIHGDRDRVLPCRGTSVDHLIAGGGHVISLTHGPQVNAILRSILRRFDPSAAGR